jgi:hypothetical protein
VAGHAAPAGADQATGRDRAADDAGCDAERGEQAGEGGGERRDTDDQAERRERADPHPAGCGFDGYGLLDDGVGGGARHHALSGRVLGFGTVDDAPVVDLGVAGGVEGRVRFLIRRPVTVRNAELHGGPPERSNSMTTFPGTQRR